MARLRKFVAYRRLERPYTRKSKYKPKSFVKSTPNIVVVRFDTGNPRKNFTHTINLVSKSPVQVRHNAIESARLSSNRILEKEVGKQNYHMKIKVYPHHVLRENPIAAGAGADRMSTGMKMSFGKPIGAAAQVRENQVLISLKLDKQNLELGKKALARAAHKFPCSCRILVENNS